MYRRIRDMREDHDLYQRDLAEYLQCSQVCYSNYETGKRDIPTEVLIRAGGAVSHQHRLSALPDGRPQALSACRQITPAQLVQK